MAEAINVSIGLIRCDPLSRAITTFLTRVKNAIIVLKALSRYLGGVEHHGLWNQPGRQRLGDVYGVSCGEGVSCMGLERVEGITLQRWRETCWLMCHFSDGGRLVPDCLKSAIGEILWEGPSVHSLVCGRTLMHSSMSVSRVMGSSCLRVFSWYLMCSFCMESWKRGIGDVFSWQRM